MKPRSSDDLRRAFTAFFTERDHRLVRSSPLIPREDPTLLFANAGMNQFKDIFLGRTPAGSPPRAVSVQKCVRAGGKHNDLENVGFTPRHHTFFEMLGNFSFGDYFKEEAIALAWEFLTDTLEIPPERLSASVFAGDAEIPRDEEAERCWRKYLPGERIRALPASENFWAMGETGPCGPCSEIHFDQGADFPGEDRHLEIWNLVFMQFDRDDSGALTPLPAPSVDTGMGLERLAAVIQGRVSNYDTDLFSGLVEWVRERAAAPSGKTLDSAARVLADHARATAFLVADGVLPANDGRGYVLRKILRRALRYGRKAEIPGPFLADLTSLAIRDMEYGYPELREAHDLVLRVAGFEEERFSGTLRAAMTQLDQILASEETLRDRRIPGEAAFRLYDTFGLPLDLTEEVAREQGIGVDVAGFEAAMRAQRERARKSWKGKPAAGSTRYLDFTDERGTEFTGYEALETAGAAVLAALAEGEEGIPRPVPALREGESGELILSRTPFYPEGGGQIGDRGTLRGPGGIAEVRDARSQDGLVVHLVRIRHGSIGIGDALEAKVDRARRDGARRHHTVTHLLHAALRDILGLHVKQAGSLVAPERLRFDFTHFAALTPGEIESIEGQVNEQIRSNREVRASEMSLDAALERGALAFFGDKYGTEVRVIEIPDFSIELCGGTHLGSTGEAGLFVIISEESVAAGVRRIEARTGSAAFEHLLANRRLLQEIGQAAKGRPEEAASRFGKLEAQLLQARREISRLTDQLAAKTLGASAEDGGVERVGKVLLWAPPPFDGVSREEHRRLMDGFRDRQQDDSWVALLSVIRDGRVAVILSVSDDLATTIPANELLRDAVSEIGGRAGGRANRAEGGGSDPKGLPAMATRIRDRIAGLDAV